MTNLSMNQKNMTLLGPYCECNCSYYFTYILVYPQLPFKHEKDMNLTFLKISMLEQNKKKSVCFYMDLLLKSPVIIGAFYDHLKS